jgi:alpha/beta superfamily hydrolase
MEDKINFYSEGYEIEGILEKGNNGKGVVITHPHPLYGGNMHNNVVAAISRAYRKAGHTSLKFNFRGVGGSGGEYDDGIGEQNDVRAAVAYLDNLGMAKIDLAGYSFGSWVNALSINTMDQVENMIMVSPPVAFIDFGSMSDLDKLKLIVTGSRDDIAPAERIKNLYRGWNPAAHLEVIKGADHFYGGYLDELEAVLTIRLGAGN